MYPIVHHIMLYFFLIHRNYLCIVIKALGKTFSSTNTDIIVKFLYSTMFVGVHTNGPRRYKGTILQKNHRKLIPL